MIAALASVDLSTLTGADRKALALAALPGVRLWRGKGKWGRVGQSVALDVAGRMTVKGLMRVDRSGREAELVLTHAGQKVYAVLTERKGRRG